jgi:hypothetical protein
MVNVMYLMLSMVRLMVLAMVVSSAFTRLLVEGHMLIDIRIQSRLLLTLPPLSMSTECSRKSYHRQFYKLVKEGGCRTRRAHFGCCR